MRFKKIIPTFLFLPLISAAAPKQAADFMSQSTSLRKSLGPEKAFNKKAAKILEFEKDLEATLDEYKKLNPTQGEGKEQKVAFIYDTFEPVFKLGHKKAADKKACEDAKYTVTYEDSMGRGENPPLTPEAQDALAWVELLCRK